MLLGLSKLALPCAVLGAAFLMTTVRSNATPTYAKKEGGAKCTVCHVAAGKKDLNDIGKCYKEHDHILTSCQAK